MTAGISAVFLMVVLLTYATQHFWAEYISTNDSLFPAFMVACLFIMILGFILCMLRAYDMISLGGHQIDTIHCHRSKHCGVFVAIIYC